MRDKERKGVAAMSKYIENVNTYLTQMKIKQTFISLKTGIDKNKLYRILTGTQNITDLDMEKIANEIRKKTEYFLSDDFFIPDYNNFMGREIVCYAGEPTREQEAFAEKLIDLIENVDEVLSAKNRFMDAMMG